MISIPVLLQKSVTFSFVITVRQKWILCFCRKFCWRIIYSSTTFDTVDR